MSTALSITLFILGELLLLAVGLSLFLFRLNRKQLRAFVAYKHKHGASNTSTDETVTATQTSIAGSMQDHFNQTITHTQNQLDQVDDEQRTLLEKRIAFLESEASALLDDNASDQYWTNLLQRLSVMAPTLPGPPNTVEDDLSQHNTPDVAVPQDDSNTDTQAENEITSLDEELVADSPPDTSNDAQPGTSQKDIRRLRNILSKQLGIINELKQKLQGNTEDGDHSQELENPIEDLEVSHAQFNMCINALEKENVRLTALLQTNDDDSNSGNSADTTHSEIKEANIEYIETQQRLQQAETTINNLENINETQYQEIERLQNEITTLKTQLEEKQQLLGKHEADQSDLSKIDENDETLNPTAIQQEIESITEQLEIKKQALTEIQSLHSGSDDKQKPIMQTADETKKDSLLTSSQESTATRVSNNKDNAMSADEQEMKTAVTEDINHEKTTPNTDNKNHLKTAAGASDTNKEQPTNDAANIGGVSPQNLLDEDVLNQSNLDDFNYEEYLKDASKITDNQNNVMEEQAIVAPITDKAAQQ
ncbi:MAG: hypothetical protein GXP08_05325 [Gammaproteobacteria bacterium]|nr:hypothetical protein [Gammaproteobacteria bacterium]